MIDYGRLNSMTSNSHQGTYGTLKKVLRIYSSLNHWGQVTHICVAELGHHWFRLWLVPCSAPSYYLNQCWNIVNWTFRKKLEWNFNRNSNIFIQEIAIENVVCKMASILSQPQWVNHYQPCVWLLMISCLAVTGQSINSCSAEEHKQSGWK